MHSYQVSIHDFSVLPKLHQCITDIINHIVQIIKSSQPLSLILKTTNHFSLHHHQSTEPSQHITTHAPSLKPSCTVPSHHPQRHTHQPHQIPHTLPTPIITFTHSPIILPNLSSPVTSSKAHTHLPPKKDFHHFVYEEVSTQV